MRLSDFIALNEKLSEKSMRERGDTVKSLIGDEMGKLFMVPDFDTFKRPSEPVQHTILFTNNNLNSFSLNYTDRGKIYSIDFWKPEKSNPVITVYIEPGTKEEDIAEYIPKISKNPKKGLSPKLLESKKVPQFKIIDPKPETTVDPEIRKAEKELESEYEFGDPETLFKDLSRYVSMVIKGIQPSLLITGAPGLGKTFLIMKQIKEAGLEKGKDYVTITGRSTAAGMYVELYENNGKLIIFDDCDSIFDYKDGVNILKGALDSNDVREISWLAGRALKSPTTGKNIPKQFEFTGRVIFISNLPQAKIDSAIKSRSFMLEVALSPEDMLQRMKDVLPKVKPEIPLPLKEEALEFIEAASEEVENLELNMRTLVKAIKILKEVDDLDVAERLIMQQCSYK
jgi:hypothetical protein